MSKLKNLKLSKLRFSKATLEILENLKNIKAASIQLSTIAGASDSAPKLDDTERTIFMALRLAGVKVDKPEDEPDFDKEAPFFTADFTVLCDVSKVSKSKKGIDELISEEFWYYGSNLYQVLRSRALMALKDAGLPFAPPFDIRGDGIELLYTKPKF